MVTATGFHPGELVVQERAGVRAEAARLAGMLEPTDLSGGFSRFLAGRSLAFMTARDRAGLLWISPLSGPPGFLAADGRRLRVRSQFDAGDPLADAAPGQPVGLLVIDLATRRRVRVNGELTAADPDGLTVAVEQAYGNCPQYIHRRDLNPPSTVDSSRPAARWSCTLDSDQERRIAAADTFFLGTVHPERGADAAHRGGPAGFVRVDGSGLAWPDYPGNNMFNSLGNLAIDPTAALLFPDFTTGTVLQLSGRAAVVWDGSDRGLRFTPTGVVDSVRPALRETDAGGM